MNPLRPYEPLRMTTKKWKKIKPQLVDIHSLIPSQENLCPHPLPKGHSFCGDKIIHVVLFEGKKFISDGHNRVHEAKVDGETMIEARIKIA